MQTHKFKVGDTVRCIEPAGPHYIVGKFYIIRGIREDKWYISGYCIETVSDSQGNTDNGTCMNRFEPAYIQEFQDKLEDLIK
jgi:hypothetical protein